MVEDGELVVGDVAVVEVVGDVVAGPVDRRRGAVEGRIGELAAGVVVLRGVGELRTEAALERELIEEAPR